MSLPDHDRVHPINFLARPSGPALEFSPVEWREIEEFWEGFIMVRRPTRAYHPPTNLYETDDEFVVMVAVSMADRESLRVIYEAGTLLIQGQRLEPEEEVSKRYHLIEITLGPFERRIIINAEIDPEGIKSTYTEGMLTIRIPKVKPREIGIRED